MMSPHVTKLAVGILAIVLGGGVVILISNLGHSPNSMSPSTQGAGTVSSPETIHTAAWYVAHPDVLKQDEKRCAGDAASMSSAACQNVDSADLQLSIFDMKNAAAANAAAGNNPAAQPHKSP